MTTESKRRSPHTFWYREPRGFANEIDICRIPAADTALQDAAEKAGYKRQSRTEITARIRWVNGENDAWGSNRAFGHINLQAVLNDPAYLATHANFPDYDFDQDA